MQIAAEWVCFDIPFLIQAENSIDGNENARFHPYRDGISAEIRIEKKPTEHPSGQMAGLVEGDRLGTVSQTRIQVGFNSEFLSTIPDELTTDFEHVKADAYMRKMPELEGRDGFLIEAAVDYLNRFLDVYRTELDRYWIRELLPEEIVYFTLHSIVTDEQKHRRIRWFSGGTLVPMTAAISVEDTAYLNALLEEEAQIPVHQELDLAAQDKIDLREYDIAVINAATMFEAWLKNALRTVLRAEGLPEAEIESHFKHSPDHYKSITTIATDVVGRALHLNFEDTDEFSAWKKHTRNLRNDVIHEGYQPTKSEAEDAYTASTDAVDFLEEKVDKRLAELST